MMNDSTKLRKLALALYKPPFKYMHGYIFDAEGEMVSDEAGQHITEIRGWGRISYMDNPETLQDAVGELVAEALTKFWEQK